MNTVALVGRLLVSLAAVLGLMWLVGRRLRKGGRFKDTKLIDVLARQQLSRNSSVAVVRIGEQALVVGVTDSQVTVLGETDLVAAQAIVATQGKPAATTRRSAHSAAPRRLSVPPATTARVAAHADTEVPADYPEGATRRSPIAGSALSPQTWKQTIESLRDLTSRSA